VGVIGVFVPLLPTTVFLLIGAWAWGKGAPQWRARLLLHPKWGEPLRLWLNGRRLTRKSKWSATLGIALSWGVSVAVLGLQASTIAVGVGLSLLLTWLWARPEPR